MHRRNKGNHVQYGELEANGCRPFLEDANSSDDDDLVDGAASNKESINFRHLDANEGGYDESQWAEGKTKTPWSVILLSALLFVAGTGCLILAAMIAAGYMDSSFDDRMWSALLLGALMFTPGAYYLGLTLCVWFRLFGCTFDHIPQFNT